MDADIYCIIYDRYHSAERSIIRYNWQYSFSNRRVLFLRRCGYITERKEIMPEKKKAPAKKKQTVASGRQIERKPKKKSKA